MAVAFEIRWGSQKFPVELTDEEYNAMTVTDLKLKCQQWTKIEPPFMKLLAKGAVLKNETELIKNYKIVSGSKVMLMGSKKPLIEPKPKENASIASKLQWIKTMRETFFKRELDRYEQKVQDHLLLYDKDLPTQDDRQTKELVDDANFYHEKLMEMIAQLDTMPEASEAEKIERKKNVKDTEAMLDLLESIKAKLLAMKKE